MGKLLNLVVGLGVLAACGGGGGTQSPTGTPPATGPQVSGLLNGQASSAYVVVTVEGTTGRAREVTAVNGAYAVADIGAGLFTVTPHVAGITFAPLSRQVVVGAADVGDVTFTSTPGGCDNVSGQLTGDDVVFGIPIELSGPYGGTLWTDSTGKFRFESVGSGSVALTPAARAGYSAFPATRSVSITNPAIGPRCGGMLGHPDNNFMLIQERSIGSGTYCNSNGWCWERPAPTGNTLNAIWGSGPSDVWAVGDGGTILHWNGKEWSPVPVSNHGQFRAVWGSGPSDVWISGSGGLLRCDGSGCHPYTGGYPYYTGTTISGLSVPTTIWGAGPNDVYMFSDVSSGLLHWNGTSISLVAGFGSVDSIGGSGPNDVWVADGSTALQHWNGTSWAQVPITIDGRNATRCDELWVAAPNDVWVWRCQATSASGSPSAARWNGTTWRSAGDLGQVSKIWGTGSSNVYAALPSGIARWDGAAWRMIGGSPSDVVRAGWSSSPSDLWIAGAGILRHQDGNTWTTATDRLIGELDSISPAVWASGPDDAWYFAASAAFHWDGIRWTSREFPTRLGDRWAVTGVGGRGPDDIWVSAVGALKRGVYHWNGASWSEVFSGADGIHPGRLWVGATGDVWLAGFDDSANGRLLHWDGTTWNDVPVGTVAGLKAVSGTSASDIWAVGGTYKNGLPQDGVVLHSDGTTWTTSLTIPLTGASAIWGSGRNDVYVVAGVQILHWNGATWSTVAAFPTGVDGSDVWGSGPNDVWAVGIPSFKAFNEGVSTVLHWDGLLWTTQWTGNPYGFTSLSGTGPLDVWGAGAWNDGSYRGYPILQRYRP